MKTVIGAIATFVFPSFATTGEPHLGIFETQCWKQQVSAQP
ncbi:MAG TPA: hypothetical protein V6C95_21265 [Coleofasciculaceae cyanobacterium]